MSVRNRLSGRNISAIIIAISCVFSASAVYAGADVEKNAEAWSMNSWLAQKTATGNWGGCRDSLEDAGVTITSNYTTDIGGNVTGGLKKTAKYSGALYWAGAFDFEKMASIKGLNLKVSNYLMSGRNLSAAIGNFYWVQEVYADGDYYFSELDLSLSLLDDMFVFEVGRIFAGDIFGVPPFAQYYLTSALNGRMGIIPSDVFFPHYVIAAWGVRATFQPNREWYFITGLYNADSNVSRPSKHGVDFSFDFDEGYLIAGQLTYKHGHDKDKNDLPGSASFGGYYESSDFDDLSDPARVRSGNYGLYVMADQMIYRNEWPEFEGPVHMLSGALLGERHRKPYSQQTAVPLDRPKGLSVWGAAVLAPDEYVNVQTYELATGLVYQGLPPGRNRDVTAFCFVLGHFSGKLEGQSNEMVLEFNHRFQLGPWCYITPDIQYVIQPNGQSDIDNALVLGFETGFSF